MLPPARSLRCSSISNVATDRNPYGLRLSDPVTAIAEPPEETPAIPMARKQLPLIQDVQSEEW